MEVSHTGFQRLSKEKNDGQTVKEVLELVSVSKSSERKLLELCIMRKKREKVNSILLSVGTNNTARTVVSDNRTRNVALNADAPAEYVTVAKALECQREKEVQDVHD